MEQYGKLVRDGSREHAKGEEHRRVRASRQGRQTGNSPRYTMEFRGRARGQEPPDIFEVRGQK